MAQIISDARVEEQCNALTQRLIDMKNHLNVVYTPLKRHFPSASIKTNT